MLSSTAEKPADLAETQQTTPKTGNLVSRKIWLPKVIYDALPYFYLVAGMLAFFTTLYISDWFWFLPHYLLFSAACFHLGMLVYHRRHRGDDEVD